MAFSVQNIGKRKRIAKIFLQTVIPYSKIKKNYYII